MPISKFLNSEFEKCLYTVVYMKKIPFIVVNAFFVCNFFAIRKSYCSIVVYLSVSTS